METPKTAYARALKSLIALSHMSMERLAVECGSVRGTGQDQIKRACGGKIPLNPAAQTTVSSVLKGKTGITDEHLANLTEFWIAACEEHERNKPRGQVQSVAYRDWVKLDYTLQQRPSQWLRFMDPKVEQLQLVEKTPFGRHLATPDYATRLAYIGCMGACNWLNLAKHEEYMSSRRRTDLAEAATNLIKDLNIRSYVSLGCGDGVVDKQILEQAFGEGEVVYVPIDISHALLTEARTHLQDTAPIPFDVLGDFESNFKFIASNMERLPGPRCYAMLGNTLENLVAGEDKFFNNLRRAFQPDDVMLLHVRTFTQGYKPEDDPWYSIENYFPAQREFLELPLHRLLGPSVDHVPLQSLIAPRKLGQGTGDPSKVAGTQTFDLYCEQIKHSVLRIDRYDEQELVRYLERQGFHVRACKPMPIDKRPLQDSLLIMTRQPAPVVEALIVQNTEDELASSRN
jgi:hypothetical protein